MDYREYITKQLGNCLKETNFKGSERKVGKVRDRYVFNDKLVIITTDRQSAFDRVLASVPFKGQVLNLTSAWWFDKTRHIVPNHIIEVPDLVASVVKKCEVFPVEFIVRGYMTGSTKTSVWTNYQKGARTFCGNQLPEGMKKNQKFNVPIITPTTKGETDTNISPEEIINQNIMKVEDYNYCSQKAMELFRFGQATAMQNGLVLVDTKYEFGRDDQGKILLIDEIHTPDSSRYWIAESYEERFGNGQEPENIDKEFLRIWFKDHCDPYQDKELPDAPQDLVVELSRRYIMLYEMITGKKFEFPDSQELVESRISRNLAKFFPAESKFVTASTISEVKKKESNTLSANDLSQGEDLIEEEKFKEKKKTGLSDRKVVIVMGSSSDQAHADKIITKLNEFGIKHDLRIASAHKQAIKLMEIIAKYKSDSVVYVTIAGRSNALSGFVAGNTEQIVIACPPFKDKLDMMVNINSSLQMPSNVPVMTILDPGNTVLAIKRIFDL